jgi:hypothetical protein
VRDTSFETFVTGIRFRAIQPLAPLSRAQATLRARLDRTPLPLDVCITSLPQRGVQLRRRLLPVCQVPRMSTFAVASIINDAVSRLSPGSAFVNVGVWNGFTLLSGMAGNAGRACIGVDNFSEFGGPREAFLARFERARAAGHSFYDMDYRDYFARQHDAPIGVYLYDGEHSYEQQLAGLELAEPFFARDCIILVDDINAEQPRQATADFLAARPGRYRVLLDQQTSANGHPTFWNGLMVIQGVS